LSATFWSRFAAAALLLVFVLMAGTTVLSNQQMSNRTDLLVSAQQSSNLYNDARRHADNALGLIILYDFTRDEAWLDAAAEANAGLGTTLQQIASSDHPGDREFVAWLGRYALPVMEIFARAIDDPDVALDDLGPEYLAAYGLLYDSVASGALGDPSIVDRLPDPASYDDDPNLGVNPIGVIVEEMALQRERRALSQLEAASRAADTQAVFTPALFGVALVIGCFLIALMYVAERRAVKSRTEVEMLRRMATTDPLTGLGNVRGFEEALRQAEAGEAGGRVTLVLLDLDGFKAVNDSFGHARGDAVLRTFAKIVSKHAVPGTGRFRVGGDEFALVFHGHGAATAIEVAQAIRGDADRQLGHGVTVSAGVATSDAKTGLDADLLRRQADAALYTAKMNGRDLVEAFQPEESEHALFSTAKLRAFRELLAEGRIEPVFQPIWDIGTETLLGYEGLSRPDPSYGLDGPQEAFDIAEHFGHAADLDTLCRRHTLASVREVAGEHTTFVNLSPYTLANRSFSPRVLLDEIAAAGLEPAQVVFEVTEHSRVPVESIADSLCALSEAGIRIGLDDVGSGQDGLRLLARVPFEFVKIDRSVIVSATEPGPGRGALMAILAFAAESGAHVVAEGIEDEAMFSLVRDFALQQIKGSPGLIHGVQGFLFGYPAPAAQIAQDGEQVFPWPQDGTTRAA
jgi:diguanylate cyclase (GGDEF)-like protein